VEVQLLAYNVDPSVVADEHDQTSPYFRIDMEITAPDFVVTPSYIKV